MVVACQATTRALSAVYLLLTFGAYTTAHVFIGATRMEHTHRARRFEAWQAAPSHEAELAVSRIPRIPFLTQECRPADAIA